MNKLPPKEVAIFNSCLNKQLGENTRLDKE